MSRWFRHYVGMARDPKLVGIASRTQQTVERVAFVWAVILEDACEAQSGGAYELDVHAVAYHLRCEPDDIAAIHIALQQAGLVDGSIVIKWAQRQFESDGSTERSRKHRATKRNGDATLQGRCATPPDTETDTEKKEREDEGAAAPITINEEKYAYQGAVIRLTHAHWRKFSGDFPNLTRLNTLKPCLAKLDALYVRDGVKDWWIRVQNALANMDREAATELASRTAALSNPDPPKRVERRI